jgi:hypothetical protein
VLLYAPDRGGETFHIARRLLRTARMSRTLSSSRGGAG